MGWLIILFIEFDNTQNIWYNIVCCKRIRISLIKSEKLYIKINYFFFNKCQLICIFLDIYLDNISKK